jgi:3-oxoacyl-[acyl-carrier protein] reductase
VGQVIFISSTAANVGGVVGPHYAASKAGLIGLMHSYASQLVKEGITANVISPALIETDRCGAIGSTYHPGPNTCRQVRRRRGSCRGWPMLARNGYITGQSINVSGGLYPTS